MKLTKQGVRDLNYIPSPPKKTLELPPSKVMCSHKRRRLDPFKAVVFCLDCGEEWDVTEGMWS
jgi:hypothetical protein